MAAVPVKGVRVVRESVWYTDDEGQPQLLAEGMTVREGHPLVKKFQKYFYPVNFVDIDM